MDIHIPHTNGLEVAAVLSRLPAPPLVVFVTAYDQHAISAFEINAVDYVLKPYDRDRFRRACQKVRDWLGKREEARGRLSGLVDYLGRQKTCSLTGRNRRGKDRIFIRYEDVAFFRIELTEMLVTLRNGEELIVSGPLSSLMDQLDPEKFHQTHRSFIVSLDAVERISPLFSGNFEIILKAPPKTKIPLSRRYAQKLRKVLPW
jgi:DNA-binding LytR/AlgR family response regulator